jgi:predicted phage-related endonuclease
MTATLVQIDSERQEFLEARKLGIGGSDCAAVFNEGYGCSRALWYDKTDTPRDFERTDRELRILRRGTLMEEVVADEYSAVTGRKIRRLGTKVSKTYPFMRVNIDRQIVNDSRGPGVLEVKTASPWIFRDMNAPDPETGGAKGLPTQYVLQMQHSLAVTGYQWGAFAVMNASSWDMLTFEITRNEALIDEIARREFDFWLSVDNGAPPQQLEKSNDRRCANCSWRKTCRGQAVIVPERDSEYVEDDSLAELAIDYRDATQLVENYEALADDIKKRLQEAVAGRTGIIIPSVGYRIRWKEQKGRSGWDSKALQSLVDGLRRIGADPMALKVEECRKQGANTRPFYFERYEERI